MRQGRALGHARPWRREGAQGLEVEVGAAAVLQVVDAVVLRPAQAGHQGQPPGGVVGPAIDLDGVEERAGFGQGLEGLGGQKRDLGVGVGLADALKRRKGEHEVPHGGQLDHQDLADRLHARASTTCR